jgi:two-component system, chemotaxis family, CheB/CheR fusion protein
MAERPGKQKRPRRVKPKGAGAPPAETISHLHAELLATCERLQATIEKLQTVNTELNSKVEGLERATNDRKNLLAAIVESSLDAIIGMTLDGTITTWNAGAERIYGYTAGEAVGSSLSLIVPPERQDELRTLIERGRRPQIGEPIEMERVANDGRRLVVASTVSPVRDGAGKVTLLSAFERDITERKHAEERQHVLLAELNHRVRNTLATVLSLLRQSLRHSASIKEFSQAFEGRIRALAKSHDLLAATKWAGADLEALVVTALAPYRERGDRVVVSGDRVILNAASALLFGMILHELATNATKHGALSNERGQVEVSWTKNARTKRLAVTWAEMNSPHAAEPGKSKGFGMTLIERGLAHELKGEAGFDFRGGGLRCSLEVPLAEIEAEDATVVRRRRP